MENIKKTLNDIPILFQNGKFSIVNSNFDLIKKHHKNDLNLLSILGVSLIKENLYENAIEIYLILKSLKPNDKNIISNIGNLYRLIGKYDLSIKYFKESLELDTKNYNVLYNLALSYSSIDNFQNALDYYMMALRHISNDQEELVNEISGNYLSLLIKQGANKQAVEVGNDLLKRFPNSYIIKWKLANLYVWSNEYSKATKLYKRALEIQPGNAAIKYDIAMLNNKIGKNNEAINILRDLNFGDSRSHYILGLFQTGKKDEFLYELNKACASFKGDRMLANLSKYVSFLYNKDDLYPFCSDPFNFIYTSKIQKKDLIKEVLKELDSIDIEPQNQDLITNGVQSSGDLFQLNLTNLDELKKIILKEIDTYRLSFSGKDEYFIKHWPKKTFLKSWSVKLHEKGELDYHIHPLGWVSGTVYLEIPPTIENKEGSIQFGFNNANYAFIENLPTRTFTPEECDIIIFPSSLSHRVNSFSQKERRRVSLAFDLMPIVD